MRKMIIAASVAVSAAAAVLAPAASAFAGDGGRSNVNAPQFGLININGDILPCALPWSDGVNVTVVNNKKIAQCQERTYTDQGQNAPVLSSVLGQSNLGL